ncbi:MAG: putative anti-sigma regulatory factor, serine/threonine protein kinase [Streptosporangiaceae bacterium]|nr:putative anti-sigma regulatory factor, serine/threonine protein kinase [Streptosporangiaceae bacterium]
MTTLTTATYGPVPSDAMCWRRSFPGRADQGHSVRQLATVLLGNGRLTDDLVQALAELFCNAVQHTHSGDPGGLVLVEIRRWSGGAAISVTDQGGPGHPIPKEPEPLAENGRGLYTVSAYAASWGWHGSTHGRTVTAVFTA